MGPRIATGALWRFNPKRIGDGNAPTAPRSVSRPESDTACGVWRVKDASLRYSEEAAQEEKARTLLLYKEASPMSMPNLFHTVLFHTLSVVGVVVILIGWQGVHNSAIIIVGLALVVASLIPAILAHRQSRTKGEGTR